MEPVTVVTGTPGAGKTLWTITTVEAERSKRGLPVFYAGIPELKTSWVKIEPEQWHQVDGPAIVVIDEAHRAFPPRPPGSKAPAVVEPFDQLRHKGLEVVLITQHPSELDHYIRRRIGRHVHLERVFGRERTRKFEWQELGDPTDYHSKKKAMTETFAFPREGYALYKSAEAHTIKKRLPWRELGWRLGLPVAGMVIGIGAPIWWLLGARESVQDRFAVQPQAQVVPSAATASPARADAAFDASRWSSRWTERIEGIPYSAPFYDALVRPVSFPKISGCIELRLGHRVQCTCNTQQGTRITSMSVRECQHWLKNG